MKAIVIGAGIGGLSAAVALKQSGIDCDVYEAVKEIKPVGAAISVWPNGVKCMAHLGMGDIMETFGGPLRRMAYRDFRSGENMTQFSLAPLIERTGSRPARSPGQNCSGKCWITGDGTACSSANASPAVKKTPTA
ncbi:putative flavoprotein monooxygenase [Klebsiella pneumoniae]|nr:putative flavoprotein monooxygenase [Klebsiella pneumoniae]VXZ84807.1 3-hydroxybenzoate 6-hydroxylase 1 [Klebsiella pneumoniae]